jgi:hypothetical protein
MDWTDCAGAWTRQDVPAASAAELAALEAGFERRRQALASARLVRLLVEGSMGPLVALGLAIGGWITGRSGWPLAAAILLILGGFAVTSGACWLSARRARRAQAGPDAPLLAQVEADLADLQRRRRGLLTMRTWHYGPVYAAALLIPFMLALRGPGGAGWFPVAFSCYFSAVLLLSWMHNRREVRRRIDPRLDELERLRRGLLAGGA